MNMKPVKKFFFWTGGVILPRIVSATIELLEKKSRHSLLNHQRFLLYEAEKDLAMGRMTPEAYLIQSCSLIDGLISPDNLCRELIEWMKVDTGALSTAMDLMQSSQVYLVSDYPRAWNQASQNQMKMISQFTANNVIYSAEMQLEDPFSSVFEELTAGGVIEQGASLWVDAHPLRISAAIRSGMDAIIYVDERRLRRELNLRQLLATRTKEP